MLDSAKKMLLKCSTPTLFAFLAVSIISIPNYAKAAIAFDTTATANSSSVSGVTIGSGSDNLVLVQLQTNSDTGCVNVDDIYLDGVTAGAVQIDAQEFPSFAANCQYLWYLKGVSAGTHTFTAHGGASTGYIQITSYSGVDQTTPIGDHQKDAGAPSVSSQSTTVTTSDANSWVAGGTLFSGGSLTSITNMTVRSPQMGDTDGPATLGAQSYTTNISAGVNILNIFAELIPTGGTPPPPPPTPVATSTPVNLVLGTTTTFYLMSQFSFYSLLLFFIGLISTVWIYLLLA